MNEHELNRLKRYVKEHPDHKMAWYLLGKEYESIGQSGKANYCFAKAGDIYEAYEQMPIEERLPGINSVMGKLNVSDIRDEDRIKQPEESGRKRLHTASGSRTAASVKRRLGLKPMWLVLLGLATIGALPMQKANAPEPQRIYPVSIPTVGSAGAVMTPAAREAGTANAGPITVLPVFGSLTSDEFARIAKDLLLTAGRIGPTVVVQPKSDESRGWVLWPPQPEVLLSAAPSADGKGLGVLYHRADLCECEPSDPKPFRAKVAEWQEQQLQRVLLASAQAAYERQTGVKATKLGQLVAPYPNNTLSGVTPLMQSMFGQEAQPEQQAPKSAAVPTAGTMQGAGGGSGSQAQPTRLAQWELTKPLEIIVDLSTHRLALVSGNIIVRSYPVGLGAPKTPTPEGEFAVTEKVREPNGRTDGDFGSRGMTLSDTLYAIHGTNKPSSVGKNESLGCIRMLREDLEELFDLTPKGTKVTIKAKANLPPDIQRAGAPMRLPLLVEERNPNKRYRWLD